MGSLPRIMLIFFTTQNFLSVTGTLGISSPPYVSERDSLNIAWRAHICTWAAVQSLGVEGDFVECGVWYGVLSKVICHYLQWQNFEDKKFYLFDTWGSMPGSHPHENYQADTYDIVRQRFASFPNVKLIRGVVPQSLSDISHVKKLAFIMIDLNGHNDSKSERAALESLYPRLSRGGIIYFDDYGWGYPGLIDTIKDFLKDKPERLLHFPSGNSILVKQ